MALPRYDITNKPKAARNGAYSDLSLSDRHSYQTRPAVINGTGARIAMFGQLNQRAAMCASMNGVHKLTMATARVTPTDYAAESSGPVLQIAFGFDDQPTRAEEGVT